MLIFGFPRRLFAFIAVTAVAAVPLVGYAVQSMTQHPLGLSGWAGAALFALLALAADFRPVPLDLNGNEVSLSFVFITAILLLFGWDVAVAVSVVSVVVPELTRGRPPLRAFFNGATYALAVGAAALPAAVIGLEPGAAEGPAQLTAGAFVCGAAYVLVNVLLVARAASLAQQTAYRPVFLQSLRQGSGAFAVMAFLAALAANLWALNPPLLALLAGPLFTLTLYQRTALRSRLALRDALTDNLTGLGNHRAYQVALHQRVDYAAREGASFSLCLIDVDEFKQINDTLGHTSGDEVLADVARLLGEVENAEAFRFGGDEFALLFDTDDRTALFAIEVVQRKLMTDGGVSHGPITISVGIASYPQHANDVQALQEVADGALYWVKRHGKNRSCIYSPSIVRIHSTADLEREAERSARIRAAQNLVKFLDAKDHSTANHSDVVATLAAEIGRELGLDDDTIAQLRLAGTLHDLGKVGVPDRLLEAPRALTNDEFEIIRRHPEFGHSLLDGLDLDPIDEWILSHHERWDGNGYPRGLTAHEIPLGARIIHVADAFEAMTADRPYARAKTREAALRELEVHAGTQFDPHVVAAFVDYLGREPAATLLRSTG
jgi:diguanylate cyclase (GGDEF)-like protein